MEFYGRKTELKKLNALLEGNKMGVALVYGRRRVGKSELIKQAVRQSQTPSIYYECKETTEKNNAESLGALASKLLKLPRLGFNGIEEILEFLFEYAKDNELVLVLDEYPYLRKTVKGLDSILQSLIDKYRNESKIKFILCGSFIDVMKSLLMNENPLYGRIDTTIELKPMDYYESSLFYPDFSYEDKVRLYSVFGGIPYYNRLINPMKSVKENIIELIASNGARLENEVSMYLKSEISKLANANEVFETLAQSNSKYSDILSKSNVSSSPALADILEKLIKMDLVKKQAPINDGQNKRKTGYYIIDNLSLFYFRYCFKYLSQMSIMEPTAFYDMYINDDFEHRYVPKVFEEIVKQYLIRKNRLGKMKVPFTEIGKYWYDNPVEKTNGEFDVVTLDENGYAFYEAKFKSAPVGNSIIYEEIKQVEKTGFKPYKYVFVSRSGFKDNVANDRVELITLAQLYNEFEM